MSQLVCFTEIIVDTLTGENSVQKAALGQHVFILSNSTANGYKTSAVN